MNANLISTTFVEIMGDHNVMSKIYNVFVHKCNMRGLVLIWVFGISIQTHTLTFTNHEIIKQSPAMAAADDQPVSQSKMAYVRLLDVCVMAETTKKLTKIPICICNFGLYVLWLIFYCNIYPEYLVHK